MHEFYVSNDFNTQTFTFSLHCFAHVESSPMLNFQTLQEVLQESPNDLRASHVHVWREVS